MKSNILKLLKLEMDRAIMALQRYYCCTREQAIEMLENNIMEPANDVIACVKPANEQN